MVDYLKGGVREKPVFLPTLKTMHFLARAYLIYTRQVLKLNIYRLLLNWLILTRKHFEDTENGGFFLTADDGEKLLIRAKEIYDGAIPSGNSVMALNLLRVHKITGQEKYLKFSRKSVLRIFWIPGKKPSRCRGFTPCFGLCIGTGKRNCYSRRAWFKRNKPVNKCYKPKLHASKSPSFSTHRYQESKNHKTFTISDQP